MTLVVASFFVIALVYSPSAKMYGKPIGGESCSNYGQSEVTHLYTQVCCQTYESEKTGERWVQCQWCYFKDPDYTQSDHCDPSYTQKRQGPGGLAGNLPSIGNTPITPNNNTVKQFPGSGLPSRLGNVLPPNNSTSTIPPGSIFKVPPGTTNAQPTGNNTGTHPRLTITKEHNLASSNILSLAGNATTTSGGHHHHKDSTSTSSTGSNSTSH